MKRSVIYAGIGYVLFGCGCIALALLTETKLESLLWGFGGAGIGPGLSMIWRYLYWSRPEHREKYAERMRVEHIELNDERKTMLRDRSGRITNTIMLCVHCVLITVISILTALGILPDAGRIFILILAAVVAFQIVCGNMVFKRLSERM